MFVSTNAHISSTTTKYFECCFGIVTDRICGLRTSTWKNSEPYCIYYFIFNHKLNNLLYKYNIGSAKVTSFPWFQKMEKISEILKGRNNLIISLRQCWLLYIFCISSVILEHTYEQFTNFKFYFCSFNRPNLYLRANLPGFCLIHGHLGLIRPNLGVCKIKTIVVDVWHQWY